jgi:ADP-heptose:LPS heptosyltransferase
VPASPNTRNQSPRRDPQLKLLIIRPGAIGDVIVSLPALEFLAATAAEVEVWTPPACVPLIGWAGRVRSIASVSLDLLELGYDPPARSLMRQFDRVVSWYGASRPEFREAVAGMPVEFHAALPAGAHAVDFYMRQVGGHNGAVPRIEVPGVAKRDFIAIHPFSGSPKKNWPLERFQELASAVPLPVEFVAGPEEQLPVARRFEDLPDLARWLASARVYCGNDSGVTHLAAAAGTPVVSIFRCTSPELWAPRGRCPVRVLEGNPAVEDVRSAVLDLLPL